jgi:hypothetical protein
MDEESKISNVSPEKLARLWDIGSEVRAKAVDEAEGADERYAELLHDWMARQLPLDPDLQELLPGALGQLCQELRPFSGDSIGALLTDPQTDIRVLTRIKDYAKELGAAAGRIEREVTLTVYFAAIASALVFHNARISQHGEKKLQSAFATMSKQDGIPPELLSLFQKATTESGSPPARK